jgi:hypothetical protein
MVIAVFVGREEIFREEVEIRPFVSCEEEKTAGQSNDGSAIKAVNIFQALN